MLDYSGPARARALRNSVLFLGHRFPNVRKTTAEALYLKLLANEDIVDEVRRLVRKTTLIRYTPSTSRMAHNVNTMILHEHRQRRLIRTITLIC